MAACAPGTSTLGLRCPTVIALRMGHASPASTRPYNPHRSLTSTHAMPRPAPTAPADEDGQARDAAYPRLCILAFPRPLVLHPQLPRHRRRPRPHRGRRHPRRTHEKTLPTAASRRSLTQDHETPVYSHGAAGLLHTDAGASGPAHDMVIPEPLGVTRCAFCGGARNAGR